MPLDLERNFGNHIEDSDEPVFDEKIYNQLSAAIFQLTRTRSFEEGELTGAEKDEYYAQLAGSREVLQQAFSQRFNAHKVLFELRELYNYYDSEKNPEDPWRNRFVAFGLGLVEELRPQIEQAMKAGEVRSTDALNAYYYLSERGNDQQVAVGLEALGDHLDLIRENLRSDTNDTSQVCLHKVLLEGSPMHQGMSASLIRDVVEENPSGLRVPTLVSYLFESPHFEKSGEREVKKILTSYNLPADDVYAAWRQSTTPRSERPEYLKAKRILDFHQAIYHNLHCLQALEQNAPGSASWLHDEFGISVFGRYPPELLQAQYEERDDRSRPYGVIILPGGKKHRNDWNGAFYGQKEPLSKLFPQIQGQFSLRAAECEGKVDIIRLLRKCNRLYNPADNSGHKISLVILGGHGTETSVQFGGKDAKHVLYIEDLERALADEPRGYFEDQLTFILASCRTGVKGKIGEKLSRKYNAKLVAPAVPTTPTEYMAGQRRGGKWRFNASYEKKDAKQIYLQGQPLDKSGENQPVV